MIVHRFCTAHHKDRRKIMKSRWIILNQPLKTLLGGADLLRLEPSSALYLTEG